MLSQNLSSTLESMDFENDSLLVKVRPSDRNMIIASCIMNNVNYSLCFDSSFEYVTKCLNCKQKKCSW